WSNRHQANNGTNTCSDCSRFLSPEHIKKHPRHCCGSRSSCRCCQGCCGERSGASCRSSVKTKPAKPKKSGSQHHITDSCRCVFRRGSTFQEYCRRKCCPTSRHMHYRSSGKIENAFLEEYPLRMPCCMC